MISGITEENYDSFEDCYKIDKLDDSELQTRCRYVEIYYNSNKSGTANDPRTIQYNMVLETNVEFIERLQHNSKEQSSASFTSRFSENIISTFELLKNIFLRTSYSHIVLLIQSCCFLSSL